MRDEEKEFERETRRDPQKHWEENPGLNLHKGERRESHKGEQCHHHCAAII